MRSAFILSTLLVGAHTGLAARSEGCGKALPQGLTQGAAGKSNAMTFGTSDSATRRYLLHIPEHYDKDKPTGLIWSFAGRGKDAEHQEKLTQLSDPSYNRDHIVVYPQADTNGTTQDTDTEEKAKAGPTHVLRRSKHDDESDPDEDDDESDDWQYEGGDDGSSSSSKGGKKGKTQSQWQGDPDSTANDVQFTLELLDRISKTFCIDTDRVFASGLSNGGGFVANILACDAVASTKFAAFAAASGAYYQNDIKGGKKNCHADTVPITCNNNGTRVPLIFTHGGSDKTISYEGGARRKSCLPSVPHFVTAWAERDGLAAKNDSSEVAGTDITHYSFGSGAEAGFVQSYYLPDLGHKWPSQDESNFSATRTFVDFFERWNMTERLAVVEAAGDGGSGGSGDGKGSGSGSSSSSSSSKKSSATPRLESGVVSTVVLTVAMAASFALF